MNVATDETQSTRRIVELIAIYRLQQSYLAAYLTLDEYLMYYLRPADWAYWLRLKNDQSYGGYLRESSG